MSKKLLVGHLVGKFRDPADKAVKAPKKKATLKQSSIPKNTPKIIDARINKPSAVKTRIQKKDSLAVPPEHETYFVYLKSPLEYRRHLLESSRKIIFCLKSHQKIFLIRQKKLEEMRRLRASVKELLYLNKKFNDKLPKYQTQFLGDSPKDIKTKPLLQVYPKSVKPVLDPKEKTEMDKLEESLANIEKKLKSLQ